MGAIKDAYDVVKDLIKEIFRPRFRQKRNLSVYLELIASLLVTIAQKFRERKIPKLESRKLAELIYNANKLAAPFRKKYTRLAKVFDKQLPKIGELMKHADFFIDGKTRLELHQRYNKKDAKFPGIADKQIEKVCEELEAAAGTISAMSEKFKIESTG